jgi:hypothetical protein
MSPASALSNQTARLRFDGFFDSARSLVFKRHRMLYSEDMSGRLTARAVLDQRLHACRSRHQPIDQIAIERIRYRAKTLQRNPIFCLTLFQLQRKLATRSQPPRQFTRRNTDSLPNGAYPSLGWPRHALSRPVWGQNAIELFKPEVSELVAHGNSPAVPALVDNSYIVGSSQ